MSINAASNLSGVSAGCTPCQCGVPGACLQEQLPFLQFIPASSIHVFTSFTVPLIMVLIPTLIARIALKHILKTDNTFLVRITSVMIGSLFVLPLIFSYFQPNTIPESTSLIAPAIAIALVYFGIVILDLRSKKTSIIGSVLGAIILLVLFFSIVFIYKSSVQTQYNQIIETRKNGVSDVLQSLGLIQRSEVVVELLKSKNYSSLENYLNPNKKLTIYFRDYGGANFSKEEFHNIQTNNQLSGVNVYKRTDGFTITAAQLIEYVNEVLLSNYQTEYYVDNHNYSDDKKNISDYSEVNFLYSTGGKRVTLTFSKDADSVWYLSKIGYYDPSLQGN